MPRKKLKRFAELEQLPNAFFNPSEMKGKWHEHFGNNNPIVLELGCGSGDYSRNLAEKFPEQNFIGIDKKGDRLWKGASESIERKNVAFVRCYADKLPEYFAEEEVSEIWITFPDPFPRPCKSDKRLTSERMLNVYRQIMKDGLVRLKTDDRNYYDFSLEVARNHASLTLRKTVDMYNEFDDEILCGIQTYYEKKWLSEGRQICYLEFKL